MQKAAISREKSGSSLHLKTERMFGGGGRTYLTICRNGVARLHDCIAQRIE